MRLHRVCHRIRRGKTLSQRTIHLLPSIRDSLHCNFSRYLQSSFLFFLTPAADPAQVHIKNAKHPDIDISVQAFASGKGFTTKSGLRHEPGDPYHVMVRNLAAVKN